MTEEVFNNIIKYTLGFLIVMLLWNMAFAIKDKLTQTVYLDGTKWVCEKSVMHTRTVWVGKTPSTIQESECVTWVGK